MNIDTMESIAAIAGLVAPKNRLADFVKFENEEDALAYATRIAQLKPGDEVIFNGKGENLVRGVFLGLGDEGRRVNVLRFDDDQEVSIAVVPWGCLRI